MLARALCYALQGVDGQPVQVETDVSGGMGQFSIVGLPDAAVRESRDLPRQTRSSINPRRNLS